MASRKVERLNAEELKLIFPKPGELVTTSTALCGCCTYSIVTCGGSFRICDYYLTTGKMRGCKQGMCNKFLERVEKRIPKQKF